ncbi:MAG: alpha amylase catalytic region, partial [Actinomycetia bacterium]|nr:alpha amylase catalytic region [Actinomycetes bacterium]
MPLPKSPQPRIQIQAVEPIVDCGRYAVKRTVGGTVDVYATVVKDGHDTLAGAVRVKAPGVRAWREEPLQAFGSDRWGGTFVPDRPGRWQFQVALWTDRIATWQDEIRRKVEAGQVDLAGELSEGALLFGHVVTVEEGLAAEAGDRHDEATSQTYEVDVDRVLARFGSWYELFPRSWGGFNGVAEVLPQLAALGFDVAYLPPVHPIGHTNRKGRNNSLTPDKNDVGSPWAIGSEEGGHDAIHPDLGTWADFDAMVAAAKAANVEIALDFAIQNSPDHPWLKAHPEWFNRRPDGTLKYAENPPKRYQDIYNVNFESEDWQGLWQALLDVVLF